MDRIFVVEGVPKVSLVYRGIILRPNQRFKVNMSEKEFNSFSEFISVINCNELKETAKQSQVSESNPKSQIENKEKEKVANGQKSTRSNRQVKNKSIV